ncbi:MAG: amidase [Pleurocapsa sp. CRU_1_2]|nr:amidase [Pleurocapsa sp. CRU_1_2]
MTDYRFSQKYGDRAQSPEFVYICQSQSNGQGSLSGLRLGVKDLFHIAGMPTTAGNPDWLTSHPQPAKYTAPSVKSLLDEGATLIGKTLTDELAYSLEGINKHYGTPINPTAPERIPGGSSSGSAVGVANSSIDIGLGTDTAGSIRVPASYNGLYGLRPSHGAVSCEHLIALAPRFDTVGWMTRDFSTLRRVAEVLLPSTVNHNLSHLVVCQIAGIESWIKACRPLLTAIASQFDSIEYVEISPKHLSLANAAFRVLQGREIWRVHGRWIDARKPDLAVEISDRFAWCQSLSENDERQAEDQAQEFIDFWHTHVLFNNEQVLLLPTTPGAAPFLNTSASLLREYRTHLLTLTTPASLTNAPQISLPYLSSDRAPWGVSLTTYSGGDRALLNCVAKLEQLLPV